MLELRWSQYVFHKRYQQGGNANITATNYLHFQEDTSCFLKR